MWDIVVPVGAMMDWPVPTVPSSQWMERNGDILAISDFPELYAVLGTRYGGDGTDTFALPDDRANFIRGWDHGRGIDVGRVFGTEQGDAIRNIVGFLPNITSDWTVYDPVDHATNALQFSTKAIFTLRATNGSAETYANVNFNAGRNVPTAAENRARNRAYLPIIKAIL